MSFSIYEIDGYQDYAKPSEQMSENEYLQDVFFTTRPEIFDFDDHSFENRDDKRNPYYKEWDRDKKEDKGDHEKSDIKNLHNPNNWDKQQPVLLNPWNDRKKRSVGRVIEQYRNPYNKGMQLYTKGIQMNFGDFALCGDNRNKTAYSLNKLMSWTSMFSKKRSTNVNVRVIKSDAKNRIWKYRAKGYESYSKRKPYNGPHTVVVSLEKNPIKKDIRQLDVRVTCSCPFWKYWGPDYNSTVRDYRFGPPMSDGQGRIEPEKRDPYRRNMICKHVHAVGISIQRFAAKHDLDTYEDVDKIVETIGEHKRLRFPNIRMNGIKSIVNTLESTEKRDLDKIIKKYDLEKDIRRQERLLDEATEKLEDILENKEKGFLHKTLDRIKNFFKKVKVKRTSLDKKASVDRVINMYLEIENKGVL